MTIEFTRDAPNDPVWQELRRRFKMIFKVPKFTEKYLKENQNVKNFCVESRHFVTLEGVNGPIYVHFDVSCWFKKPNGVRVQLDKAVVYDEFTEYEKTRVSQLHSADPGHSDIPNIN